MLALVLLCFLFNRFVCSFVRCSICVDVCLSLLYVLSLRCRVFCFWFVFMLPLLFLVLLDVVSYVSLLFYVWCVVVCLRLFVLCLYVVFNRCVGFVVFVCCVWMLCFVCFPCDIVCLLLLCVCGV